MSETNIYGLKDPTNKEMVEVIREKFLLEVDTNPQSYDPIDVDRCRTEDWQIERFLLEKGTPEEAHKALVKAMQWKKSVGVHQRNGNHFPSEMLLIFGHQKTSRDKEGSLCIWGHSNVFLKIVDFDELIRQYCVYFFEKMDREVGNKGFITISDGKGASFSNMDMGLAKFSISIMEHYPQSVKLTCTVDMHWLLQPLVKTLKLLLPKSTKDKMVICNGNELTKYIDIDINEIPVSIGGKREVIYDNSEDMRPLSQCKQHLGFTDKQIDNFYKVYGFDRDSKIN